MSVQKIFLSILFTFFGLFFVVSITYFNKSNNLEDFDLGNSQIGYNEITNSGNLVSLEKIESDLEDSKYYIDNINVIDKVYFYGSNYSKEIKETKTIFNLGKGIFLFDLYNFSGEYFIKNDYFTISLASPGKFFIDIKDTQIKIFSFDSKIDLNLLSSNNEKITNLIIYPHMFFSFNPQKIKAFKNADISRIDYLSKASSISDISYLSNDILDTNNFISKDFFENLYSNGDNIALRFLQNFFLLSFSKQEYEKYNLPNIALYKGKDLLGISYIQKYFLLFLNKNKKEIYYKKNVLLNLNKFFEKNIDYEGLLKIEPEIVSNLTNLKNLNNESYLDFQNIVLYYYDTLLKVNSIDYINSVLVLSNIVNTINNSDIKDNIYLSSFYLNKIYSLVNNKTYSKNFLQENLLTFLNSFLEENNIVYKINGDLEVNLDDGEIVKNLDYLSFFLKNILIYDINLSDKKNLANVLSIIDIYLKINKSILNFYQDDAKTESLIVEYNFLIENLLYEIRNSFFEKNLNNRGLLLISKENSISNKDLEKLNEIINRIFISYIKNKQILSEKNKIYNSYYEDNRVKYREYYSALDNYGEYQIQYDKLKKDLLDTKTIFEQDENIDLNKKNLIEFLSQFEGLDYSDIIYRVVGNKYYKIKKIYINSEEFSFDLYPYNFNIIDNIYRNGKRLSLSYELDTIQEDLKELFESAKDEEKDLYDFKKFFINTFFGEEKNDGEIFEDSQDILVEDKVVAMFKRDKLFGDKGDFSVLDKFLDLEYENVLVELKDNNYDIYIKKGFLETEIEIGENEEKKEEIKIVATIEGNYIFGNEDHYFKDIFISFYDEKKYENGEEELLFDSKEFKIDRINTINFETEIKNEIQKIFENN